MSATTTVDDLLLKGTAEANSSIKIFDSGKQIGAATTDGSGAWSYDTGHVTTGSHIFTATAADVAGNTSSASAAKTEMVTAPTTTPETPGDPGTHNGSIEITNLRDNHWRDTATIKGTADADSQVKLYDGNVSLGTVKAGADGTWSFTTSHLSNTVHTFTAQELDSSGQVTATSGKAILGSSGTNNLTSTSGNDLFVGNGHPDTFVFAANFGKDVIQDFHSGWRGHDTIQFSKSEFDSFASVLSHASQVGQDVVIATGNDSLTLKNTKLSSLDSHDFHFA